MQEISDPAAHTESLFFKIIADNRNQFHFIVDKV